MATTKVTMDGSAAEIELNDDYIRVNEKVYKDEKIDYTEYLKADPDAGK